MSEHNIQKVSFYRIYNGLWKNYFYTGDNAFYVGPHGTGKMVGRINNKIKTVAKGEWKNGELHGQKCMILLPHDLGGGIFIGRVAHNVPIKGKIIYADESIIKWTEQDTATIQAYRKFMSEPWIFRCCMTPFSEKVGRETESESTLSQFIID